MMRETAAVKTIALVDFDGTLIFADSLSYIFINEKWYFDWKLFVFGIALFAVKLLFKDINRQIPIRSIFKKRLLEKIGAQPAIIDKYSTVFKPKINYKLIDFINSQNYDSIIIASASDENLIKNLIGGLLKLDAVLSNNYKNIERDISKDRNFETCWHSVKLNKIQKYFGDLRGIKFHLYTDSYDDAPLMRISEKIYFIQKGEINEIV